MQNQENNQNQDNNIENVQNNVRKLKKFNKEIQIIIEVDQIAEMLLAKMDSNATHKELIVETIISSMMHSPKNLTPLYNSLNGWENELEWKVKDEVMVKFEDLHVSWGHKNYAGKFDMLIKCQIVSIDIYKSQEIEVQFTYLNREGDDLVGREWISKRAIQSLWTAELEKEHLEFIGNNTNKQF
jgi:hypothetical protein